jgi:hypothetical protein
MGNHACAAHGVDEAANGRRALHFERGFDTGRSTHFQKRPCAASPDRFDFQKVQSPSGPVDTGRESD